MEKKMILKLNRGSVCKMTTAINAMVREYRRQVNNPETPEEEKEICKKSLAMWEGLYNEVKRQFNEQDGE